MKALELIKGKEVDVPSFVKRYIMMVYDKLNGWNVMYGLHTTPESAVQTLIENQQRYPNDSIKYYKVVEVELEVPFINNEDGSTETL